MNERTESMPTAEEHDFRMEVGALLETLLAVETLEYHNKNWLAHDPKKRNECKRSLLVECLRHFPTTVKNSHI